MSKLRGDVVIILNNKMALYHKDPELIVVNYNICCQLFEVAQRMMMIRFEPMVCNGILLGHGCAQFSMGA